MSTLPNPPVPVPGEPPVVALLREKLGRSRIVRWAQRHRTTAATLGGLVIMFKAYRWLLPWAYDMVFNPREGIASVREHWELLAIGSGAVFVFGFITVRFGLSWLDRFQVEPGEDLSRMRPGPAWAERPHSELNAAHIPPRMG